jgi:Transposase IS66 family
VTDSVDQGLNPLDGRMALFAFHNMNAQWVGASVWVKPKLLSWCVVGHDTAAPAIPRARAGPSLLAMVLYKKFGQHQPLNWQCEHFARKGINIEISLSILADQVGTCAAVLKPLLTLIKTHVMAVGRLHDAGPLVVHPANSLRLSCSWVVEGSCLSAWEQGHDASVGGPDG